MSFRKQAIFAEEETISSFVDGENSLNFPSYKASALPKSRFCTKSSSSAFITPAISSCLRFSSGYGFSMAFATLNVNLYKNGSFWPRDLPCKNAVRISFLMTYPRPSLEGMTPSRIAKHVALIWSAIAYVLGRRS